MKYVYWFTLLALCLFTISLGQRPRRVQVHPTPSQQSGRRTTVNVYVSRDIAPAPKIRMSFNTLNVPVVTITAFKIDPVAWFLSDRDTSKPRPRVIGSAVKQWDVTVSTKDNPPNPQQPDRYYSRQVNLPSIPPGVYMLLVAGGGAQVWTVVNVTELAVVTKESPKHLLVWVTDALTGHLVSDANVVVYDSRTRRSLASGRTRADGTLFIPMGPGEKMVVVSHGKDYAGIPSSGEDPDGRLVAHFETDRPIYRPGQTVQFKTILRRTLSNGYSVVANSPVSVELRDPKNNPIDRTQLSSNAMGSIGGHFDIPEEGAAGAYTLYLNVGKQEAYHTFTVAAYRKPEYKVDTAPLQARYLAGETLRFKVSAQYYFGAPVQQAEVRYTVRRSDNYYYWRGPSEDRYFYGGDGNLYPRDSYSQTPFVAEDVVHTDEKGEAIIEVKSDPKAPDSVYVLNCTVTDSSRRQVEGGSSVPVYAANIRISVGTSLMFVPLGKLIPLDVTAVDLDGKPTSASVTLVATHQVWNEKKNEWNTVELGRTKVHVPPSGRAKATMSASAEGDIAINATAPDGTGRTATAAMSTYVVGPFEKPYKQQVNPSLATKLNKRSYEPGENVSAYVSANTKNWPILLMVEGEDIWDYKVVPASATFEFHTNRQMSPNAYFTAVQWVKGQLISANQIVPLPDRNQLLKVQLKSDKAEYRPGDNATYKVKTTTQDGKPVSAEVALTVVDAAIYALSPDNTADLYGYYWGQRANQVTMHQAAPEELSGGAYQRVSTVAPIRQRFEDTAYWNAFVSTGPDGEGAISFEMPGNLTTWKATARAVTENTAVGTDAGAVVATRPVTLRLATPRQMVQGDHLTLIGTINNRTPLSHGFMVRLVLEGLQLESEGQQNITVQGNGTGTVEWHLLADHMGSQPPALTAEVVATDVGEKDKADYADALRMVFPVHPDGVPVDMAVGGAVSASATAVLKLPTDKIEPATKTEVKIWSGVKPIMEEAAQTVLNSYRYGTAVGVDQLEIAGLEGLDNSSKPVREALALLSKNENGDGWGFWENCRSDPVLTAEVLRAFGMVQGKIEIPKSIFDAAKAFVHGDYNRTNLWEYHALLASALALSDAKEAKPLLDEVVTRGINLSPYARLRLAEGYLAIGDSASAESLVDKVVQDVSVGPSSAYLPVGEGIGWRANTIQTTAELLYVILKANSHEDLQSKLAVWLVSPNDQNWPSLEDTTSKAIALGAYLAQHPAAEHVGEASIVVNGQTIQATHGKIGDLLLAEIPNTSLSAGSNSIRITRQGPGEAFYQISAHVYRPLRTEDDEGIRVARRYEVKNSAGIWEQLKRPLKAGEPVKTTVLLWGDEVPDVIQVTDPLPAGFEFIDEEQTGNSETQVRDAAVIHYVLTGGAPVFFTYYIRAESDGDLAALPASAEVLRRPEKRGQTAEDRIVVIKP